ncbi:hypothetical protein KFE98_21585 [bacterium SCSIO 12741]|nr:hypothetical protein KFE98_21585 [bacterium SCSIO 12741]
MKKLLVVLIAGLAIWGCKKKQLGLEEEGALEFSSSEVMFDTVFTALGSTTHSFKIYNRSRKDIVVSDISLEQGSASMFRINVDGIPGEQTDVLIRGEDSAFVFVEVTVDPGNVNNPFIVEDNVVFMTNGTQQKVKLTAWGQDAYYYRPREQVQGLPAFSRISSYEDQVFVGDEIVWTNDKPHVIYGYLMVDSSLTLKIEKGTQVHLHDGAGIWVYQGGAIRCEGEKDEEVVFQGDRLEAGFDDIAGQWDRIWINEGAESSFKHTIIKNGFVGLQVETLPFDPNASISPNKLILQKTIIKNMVGIGILSRNFNLVAENVEIYNIGNQDVAINGGGDYSFTHCTFANYWSGHNRQQPLLFVNNYYQDLEGTTQNKDLKVRFGNCSFYGNKDEEIELDSADGQVFDVVFDHCIIKTEWENPSAPMFVDCLINPENGNATPVFKGPSAGENQLYSGSVAVDAGDPDITATMTDQTDLEDKARDATPDIGAYEL